MVMCASLTSLEIERAVSSVALASYTAFDPEHRTMLAHLERRGARFFPEYCFANRKPVGRYPISGNHAVPRHQLRPQHIPAPSETESLPDQTKHDMRSCLCISIGVALRDRPWDERSGDRRLFENMPGVRRA